MAEQYLFEDYELSPGFTFPDSYLAIVASGEFPDLDPWFWLAESRRLSVFWANTLREQYADRALVPFAKRDSSDDVACFDGRDSSGNPKVYYVHAFASPGWERRGAARDFEKWLKEARAESAEYKADQDETDDV